MLNAHQFTKAAGVIFAGLGLAAVAAASWSVIAVEQGVRSGYEVALAERGAIVSKPGSPGLESIKPATTPVEDGVPVARSEDDWLGHAGHRLSVPVNWTGPVSVGDRLTITLDGRAQAFEVTGVEASSNASVAAVKSGKAAEIFEITGRLSGTAGSDRGAPVRMLIEITAPVDALKGHNDLRQRAL